MPSQVMGSSRELFLVSVGHIPWSSCLYTLEIALNVRSYALPKHKTVLCYFLIGQKALLTGLRKKKESSGAMLSCLLLWNLAKIYRDGFSTMVW